MKNVLLKKKRNAAKISSPRFFSVFKDYFTIILVARVASRRM